MTSIIHATFENGLLKPDEPLDLPAGARLRLSLEILDRSSVSAAAALDELDKLCEEFPINPSGVRLTRDQLHERR